LFEADTIDGLTVEQYNILVELWNIKAGEDIKRINKYTTSIVSVEGEQDVDYEED